MGSETEGWDLRIETGIILGIFLGSENICWDLRTYMLGSETKEWGLVKEKYNFVYIYSGFFTLGSEIIYWVLKTYVGV